MRGKDGKLDSSEKYRKRIWKNHIEEIYTLKSNSACRSICVCVSVLTSLKLLEEQASNLAQLITTPW